MTSSIHPHPPSRPDRPLDPASDASKFLSVELQSQDYGVDIQCVQEVRSFEPVTRLPETSPALLGVLNLRGSVVPVCDLRLLLGMPARFDDRTVTVVLNLGTGTVGVVVDAVSDVVSVPAARMRPAPAMESGPGVRGLATLQDGDRESLLVLLDAEALLRGTAPCDLPTVNAAAADLSIH